MRVVFERCCGLDVHKASIAACGLISVKGKRQEEIRRFGTMTGDLAELTGMAAGEKNSTRRHGIDRRLLETGMERLGGGRAEPVIGECA
jgi:hypothetical protein